MSDYIDQLRSDLKALDEIRARYDKDADFTTLVNNMRDRLEAEADPWREAKAYFQRQKDREKDPRVLPLSGEAKNALAYVDYLTAENALLAAMVAELEGANDDFTEEANSLPEGVADALHQIAIGGLGPPPRIPRKKLFDMKGDDPVLDPKRVMATAAKIASEWRPDDQYLIDEVEFLATVNENDSARPYRLKGGDDVR